LIGKSSGRCFRPRDTKWEEPRDNCVRSRLMTVTPYQILFQSHNKKGAMKGVGARVEKKRTA